MKKITLLICLMTAVFQSYSQQVTRTSKPHQHPFLESLQHPRRILHTRSIGPIFDTSQWKHRIDSTWGYGVSDSEKLILFNTFWNKVRTEYPCFVQLPLYNWDSIVNQMKLEISSGVSRGRFAGIMGELMRHINDAHSGFSDNIINYGSATYLGKPLFTGYEDGYFGACITMLPDSTALVYNVAPNHPFNLQPGDIIEGYNNIPWKKLIPILLQYQMPTIQYLGSSPEATYHRYIQSVGSNWYLFDSIQIRKCDGSVFTYSTDLMLNTQFADLCTEELPVPGVPTITLNDYVNNQISNSSGVITGTRIGYVNMIDCYDSNGDSLYTHFTKLIKDSLVKGLVFDIRTNFGGSFLAYLKAMNSIHYNNFNWVGYGERNDTSNLYSMVNTGLISWYSVLDTDPDYSEIPVAILTGPNAVSAGDFIQLMFKHYDHVRTFGKSTAGAFGAYDPITLPNSEYHASKQDVNFFEYNAPSNYLSHTSYPVNKPTWFQKDSICHGVDNILSEAMQWIQQQISTPTHSLEKDHWFTLFPNPANESVSIESPIQGTVSILNCFGKIMLMQEVKAHEKTIISLGSYSNGIYLINLNTAKQNHTQKLIVAH